MPQHKQDRKPSTRRRDPMFRPPVESGEVVRLLPTPTRSPEISAHQTEPRWDDLVGPSTQTESRSGQRRHEARHPKYETLDARTARRIRAVGGWVAAKIMRVQLELAARRANPQTFVDAMNPYDSRTYNPLKDPETDDPEVRTHKAALEDYLPILSPARPQTTPEEVSSPAPTEATTAENVIVLPQQASLPPEKAFPELADVSLGAANRVVVPMQRAHEELPAHPGPHTTPPNGIAA